MTQKSLIEWLVYNLDCTICPVYEECRTAKQKTCSAMLTETLRASDSVIERMLQSQVYKIRKAKKDLIRERNPERRKKLQNHLAKLRYDLREVRKYIKRRDKTECNT